MPEVAVITGAGAGIGKSIAAELARRGYRIVASDVDAATARQTAAETGGESRVLDVSDGAAADALAREVEQSLGSLDLWVCNAGISKMQAFCDVSEDDLRRTIAVNLMGVFLCGQAAARSMIRQGHGGRIVNIASMAGKRGNAPYLSDYVASKFGVVGLTQAMACELAPHNIRVNCVCPGYVRTSMQDRELDWEAALRNSTREEVVQSYIADTAMRRLETPEDVARAVAFLASEDAGFITGEALAVNGGAYMD